MNFPKNTERGFTLIELLVVIAIIGILSSTVLATLGKSRAQARDAYRKTAMKQLEVALELYKEANGTYPIATDGLWWGTNGNGGNHDTTGSNGYIPNLAPTYIPELPKDPAGQNPTGWSGFYYRSPNGSQYKLIIHKNGSTGPESFPTLGQKFYDPTRPTSAWMICEGALGCAW